MSNYPKFKVGFTYWTLSGNTAQVLNDHGKEMRQPYRICVQGNIYWAYHNGNFGADDQMQEVVKR